MDNFLNFYKSYYFSLSFPFLFIYFFIALSFFYNLFFQQTVTNFKQPVRRVCFDFKTESLNELLMHSLINRDHSN